MLKPTDPRSLAVVPQVTISERVQRLQQEARGLAGDHVGELVALMAVAETMAKEIGAGGEAYPVGVRDIAKRLAEELGAKAQNIEAIMGRR